jgi:hypothetical protein
MVPRGVSFDAWTGDRKYYHPNQKERISPDGRYTVKEDAPREHQLGEYYREMETDPQKVQGAANDMLRMIESGNEFGAAGYQRLLANL